MTAPLTNGTGESETCPCGHSWEEHDGMGDCHHLDGRTHIGYCVRCLTNGSGRPPADWTADDAAQRIGDEYGPRCPSRLERTCTGCGRRGELPR